MDAVVRQLGAPFGHAPAARVGCTVGHGGAGRSQGYPDALSACARHRSGERRTSFFVRVVAFTLRPELLMETHAISAEPAMPYPVRLRVTAALTGRNRLTVAFRPILAIPHLLLVGGPIAAFVTWSDNNGGIQRSWGAGGALGAVAAVCAFIAWFAVVFTGRSPEGLARLEAFYLRWRVRAVAYLALFRDEYPPFGDEIYPVEVDLPLVLAPRDRLSVAFRPILVIPHLIAIWALGIAWGITTMVAWLAILFTGRYPRRLAEFGVGCFRWTTRVEAYLLLLTDEYPPFSLD